MINIRVFVCYVKEKKFHRNIFNNCSFRPQRIFERSKEFEEIKSWLQSNATFVIDWDGTLVYDLIAKEKVYRLPLLILEKSVSQILLFQNLQ